MRTLTLTSIALLLAATLSAPNAAADHEYEEGVWFNWDSLELDVLILAADDPLIHAAIEDAIQSWRKGIAVAGPSWLADGLVLRTYAPAIDPVAPADFTADIVFVPYGFYAVYYPVPAALLGEGPVCYANAPSLTHSNFYAVAAHEFGHCLGLEHVFQHGVEYSPRFDIMGSGQVAGGHACPSNLNIQVLERVFSGGRGTVTMSSGSYSQTSC